MRKFIMAFIAFLLIALPINGAFMDKAHAASSRVAIIKELKGTVKVKKAGGSKEFTAFAKMSLNEGDVLSVGGGGSAVLQFANGTSEDDKMTVSSNTKLSFSKLSSKKGTTTKVSMWSGNAWVDVKSIASASDEFTLETPTAVMGVRGTHFFVGVNPVTGVTNMTVAAGIVRTSTKTPSGGQAQDIYPTQQVILSPVKQGQPSMLTGPVDIEQIVTQSSPEIIRAFLLSATEVVAENNNLMNTYLSKMGVGKPEQELKRVRGNIENIVGAIATSTEKQPKLKELQDLISSMELLLGRDLSGIALTLSDDERTQLAKFGEMLNILQKQAEEKQKQEQLARDLELQTLLKKKQDDQKKKIEEEMKKKKDKAYEEYEAKLSQLEKDRFTKDKKSLEGTTNSNQSGSSNNGSGPGPSPSGATQDATLSNLRLFKYEGESSPPAEPPASAGVIALTPTFSPSNTEYAAEVSSNVSYVYVKPFTTNAGARVTVNGTNVTGGSSSAIPLNFGTNAITIVVTAADGVVTNTYFIEVYRQGTERLEEFYGLELTEPFDPEVFEYTGEVGNDYIVARTGAGTSVNVTLDDTPVSTYEASFMFRPNYAIGDNVLQVTVTPEIGIPVTYTFHVFNANTVKLSSLIGDTVYIQQAGDKIYSGVVDSEVSATNLFVYTKVASSIVEVTYNGTVINKESSGYSLTEYLTAGWNTFGVRVSDVSNRIPARDYVLYLWKGEASMAAVQNWTVSDNNDAAGNAKVYSDDWEIWYVPGATTIMIKPTMNADSPFTIHSVEKYGLGAEIAYPESDGSFELHMDDPSYVYGTIWLVSEGKLVGREISFRPDRPDFIYGLKKQGESSPPTAISESETTSFEMSLEATSFNFYPVFNEGIGGLVSVYDGEALVYPLDGFYSVPYSGVEKTFTIKYESYGGLTQKTYTIKLIPPSS